MARFITAEQVIEYTKNPDLYWYVRVDGEYRFLRTSSWGDPAEMLDAGERVESRGMVGVWDDGFRIMDGHPIGSVSIAADDAERMAVALGKTAVE